MYVLEGRWGKRMAAKITLRGLVWQCQREIFRGEASGMQDVWAQRVR